MTTHPFDIKEIVLLIALAIVGGFWGNDHYSLKQEKQHLQEQLQRADAIIHKYQELYDKADTAYSTAIDSANTIKQQRDENNTKPYNYSADSLEQLWSELYSH